MITQIMQMLADPKLIIPHMLGGLRRLMVRKISKDGKIFYQYKGEFYPEYLNQGNAQSFISEKALAYCDGTGIDVGADRWPLAGAIPILNKATQNAYKLDNFQDGSLDYIFSSHCLEHLGNWQDALALWIRKLRKGGIIFLYLPHESMKLWHRGGPWIGGHHKWRPTYQILIPFLQRHGVEILEFNPFRDEYWSFHIVGKKSA